MFGIICWFTETFGYFWTLVMIYLAIRGLYYFLKTNGLLPKKNVTGEHVFMTGGGNGIGKLMSKILAKQGAKITVTDINLEWAQKTVDEITKAGGEATAVKCDVSSIEEVSKAAQAARDAFGDVTMLINNAGIVTGKKILEVSNEMATKTIMINTVAHIYTTKEFLPDMIKKNHGHIVTVASSAGVCGNPGMVDYCASKFGAVGFDESLRLEIQKMGKNIDTTCINPYFINTGMFDGVKTFNDMILPILDQDWAAQRFVNAIRQKEPVVFVPFMSNTVYLTRALLPTFFLQKYFSILGLSSTMDNFKGRKKD